MIKKIIIILLLWSSNLYAGYYIYIPEEYRQHNFRASCVYASVTVCLRSVNMWDVADKFWDKYKGSWTGETASGVSNKLKQLNVKHKIIHNTDKIIDALKEGRAVAITWGYRHVVNAVGYRDGNVYILDNNRTEKYIVQSWNSFVNSFRRGGSWGVVILDGKPPKSISQKGIEGYEATIKIKSHPLK